MGDSNVRSILNLANGIVGVSILAMPYCFSKCGVILGTLLLIFCTIVTQWTCKMLMKTAVMTRNHTYENMALGVLGNTGKYFTGISVIGLNLGTCIAFFVIIGDLAPPIIAQVTAVNWSMSFLRAVILCLAAAFVTFPLGLLRSVDSLGVISLGSAIFYMVLALQLFLLSVRGMLWGWWLKISLWDNSGLLQCIPIFALAFSCQTQLFVIYGALQDSSFRRIAVVIDGSTFSVASLYFLVACFGYVSFYNVGIKGDVLSNFDVSFVSQLLRLGFSVSVMVSFPLMIFPCRMCINSLFFSSKSQELYINEPIPQQRFVAITAFIIGSTLAVAILVPNVETVLSLTGATMGTIVSFILPSVIFLNVAGWNADYSNRAKVCVTVGLSVMLLSTTSIIQTELNNREGLAHKVEAMQPAPLPGIGDINLGNMIGDQLNNPEVKGNPNPVNDGAPKLPPDQNIRKEAVDQVDRQDENNLPDRVGQPERLEKPGQAAPQPKVPPDQEQYGQGENEGENIPNKKPPNLNFQAQPAKIIAAPDIHERREPENRDSIEVEGAKDVNKHLQNEVSMLGARLNQLEQENKGLKERQEEIEQIQVEQLLRNGVAEENGNLKDTLQNGGGNNAHVAKVDPAIEIDREKDKGLGVEGGNIVGIDGGVNHDIQRRDAEQVNYDIQRRAAVINEQNVPRGQVGVDDRRKQYGNEERISVTNKSDQLK